MKPIAKNGILLVIVAALAFGPLFLARNAEFAGADVQAGEAINTVAPDYEPWFNPFYEPASGEVETFLFALQAAIGSGIFFYFLGYSKGKFNASKKEQT
ncbi:cobalamin biosynthesis protein CbiN [Desulfosporosinus sp. Tol-M]|nr:cobalamin biosynthesis protein CbiN [Desulfosporosinus sp. Tol-M]